MAWAHTAEGRALSYVVGLHRLVLTLHCADEEVRLTIDSQVDEMIFLGVSGRKAEKIELLFLHDEG